MVIKTGFRVYGQFTLFEVHMFSPPSQKTPPHCFTAAVGGKRDRQIYGIDFTFNLRQKKKRKEKKRRKLFCSCTVASVCKG